MSGAQIVAIVLVVLPALAVVIWPLWRSGSGSDTAHAAMGDTRLELYEEKASAYRALKEIAFDYEAGHLSEDDYRGLTQRYESRAADVLAALDALGPEPALAPPAATSDERPERRGWTRHPVTLAAGAAALLAFGVVIGVNVGRFAEPDQSARPAAGSMPAPVGSGDGVVGPPTLGLEPGKPIPPAILAGMLNAARESLMAGRYSEAIAAYQAVLKRDPRNVDAMTHLGLIVAIGGHSDTALETFDKAAQIDPAYAPIYLYRGQVLYEVKQDYPGAVQAWQRFLTLVPTGEDHDRIAALVKDAQAKQQQR